MKNKTKEDIKQICTNYGEEVEAYGVGTISYALTEEQFSKLFDLVEQIKKEAVEDFVEYISPWLEKSFRNSKFNREIIKQYLEKGQNE